MEKYVIAPPAGSQTNALGAEDRPWEEVHANRYPGINEYLAESTGYGIVSGCEPSISGLTVKVVAGVIHLADGTRKEIEQTSITLDNADPTNPRIDLVYIDSTGAVAKITGTAAASPSVPAVPTGGISVCNVSVAAGASTGTVNRVQTIAPKIANLGMVNVKDYGAKGDGTTDDTAAIQAAIDNNHGKRIIFGSGTYLISSPIITSATDSEKVVLDLCNATIKASSNFTGDWMIDVGGTGTEQSYFYTYRSTGVVNGVVDGGGVATGGVRSEKTSEAHFENLFINNVLKYGMQLDRTIDGGWGSSDAILFNVNINRYGNAPDATSIGLIVNGYDNNIFGVRTDKFTTGIQINGGGNFLSNCHPLWHNDTGHTTDLQYSVGFDINAQDVYLHNCYSDMFATSIKINGIYRVHVNNFFVTFDNSLTNVVHTVIKYTGDYLSCLQVDGLNITNLHDNEAYVGYDGPTAIASAAMTPFDCYFKSVTANFRKFQNPLTDKLFNSVLSHSNIKRKISNWNDNDNFNLLVAPGTYSVSGTFSKATNKFPYDGAFNGIMTVEVTPRIKNATYYAVKQTLYSGTGTSMYVRFYFKEVDPLENTETWGDWKMISLSS